MARTIGRVLLVVLTFVGLSLATVPVATAKPGGVPATEHCAAAKDNHTGVKVEAGASPKTIKVYDSRTGKYIDVVVTITGPYLELKAVDSKLELVDAKWCVKAGTEVYYGTGTSGNSHIYNKNGKLKDISYAVIYWVKSKEKCPPKKY